MCFRTRFRLSQAIALGLAHGPAELLPISSSAHVELVPWLLNWDYMDLEPELRKEFEVALHAGTAAALVIALRAELARTLRRPRLIAVVGAAAVPPALVGYALERSVERRLGTPATIAVGLIGGGMAMAWADGLPQSRSTTDARMADAALLGLAQALALFPGVSRSGATLAVARWRGFTRADSEKLSRHLALPVIAGAAALKGVRLTRRELPPCVQLPLAAGTATAFFSTLASTRILRGRKGPLALFALYRLGLAALVIRRLTDQPTTMRQ
jgi:undecaprenyl-diphosphatase